MSNSDLAAIITGILIALTVFCSLSFAEDQGQTLIEAVKKVDLGQVRELLNKGADVNAKDKDGIITRKGHSNEWIKRTQGWTPLMLAANEDQAKIAKLLIENGADVNTESPRDETALTSASYSGSAGIVKLLLEKGAEVNRVASLRYGGGTALMKAVSQGSLEVAQLLLEHGADINSRDEQGNTALTLAAARRSPGTADVVKLLLDKGAKVDSKDESGRTAVVFRRRCRRSGGSETAGGKGC